MARSADVATVVLDSLEVLYRMSEHDDVPDDYEVIAALEAVGTARGESLARVRA